MTKTDLAVVLCRLVGLYFIVNSIYGVSQSLIMIGSSLLLGGMNKFTWQFVLNMALPHLFGLLVGLVVWRKALGIGQKMAA
jgi:hypothetical protein